MGFFKINVSSKETEFKTDKNQKRALQGPTYVLLCHPVGVGVAITKTEIRGIKNSTKSLCGDPI